MLPQSIHKAPGSSNFEITNCDQCMMQELIAWKHGDALVLAAAPRPDIYHGQEEVISLRCQLIVDELLIVAAGPLYIPLRLACCGPQNRLRQ